MADSNILSDFGINILEEEIDDVISRQTSSLQMPHSQVHKDHSGGFSKCAWLSLLCSLL